MIDIPLSYWLGDGNVEQAALFLKDDLAHMIGREIEPQIASLLDQKIRARDLPPYKVATTEDVSKRLDAFFAVYLPGASVSDLGRLSGGASKEQFAFDLISPTGQGSRYVLRMDPLEALVETDRRREFETLRAMQGVVPVAKPGWLDADGRHFGRSSLIMEFCSGVAVPTDDSGLANVSGTGVQFASALREALAEEFIRHLVAIHAFDWRSADLPSFSVPDADPYQAARWRLGWCQRVWRDDKVSSSPISAIVQRWLASNLPRCDDFVFVHGDYRTGNYLFDEARGKFTAILDWELCSIGDFHADLAWAVQKVCGSSRDGLFYCCGLMPREELIGRYEKASGRVVNRKTLHFYEVLMAHQTACMVAATGLKAAKAGHSHQDVLLVWSAGCGHVLQSELCRMLTEGSTAAASCELSLP